MVHGQCQVNQFLSSILIEVRRRHPALFSGEKIVMALIVRIDVDRPYGKHPFHRHVLSRVSSDLYFPKIQACGYLEELKWMLSLLNSKKARAYDFFRRCTLPSPDVLELMKQGQHEIGLHLENSTSFESFSTEKEILEQHLGNKVSSMSKHGSGKRKFGYHHHAPYEPDKYVEWAQRAGMKLFLGNLEDPSINSSVSTNGMTVFPAAFWLEPQWRDTRKLTIDWLRSYATKNDTVLLVHPENVLECAELTESFDELVSSLETKILS